ncbi:MAG: Plug domain-containing protein [Gammaproteobacteria bacterium]|nr:Plug domain-containing protein [Gammaproteobacteria bacterium]
MQHRRAFRQLAANLALLAALFGGLFLGAGNMVMLQLDPSFAKVLHGGHGPDDPAGHDHEDPAVDALACGDGLAGRRRPAGCHRSPAGASGALSVLPRRHHPPAGGPGGCTGDDAGTHGAAGRTGHAAGDADRPPSPRPSPGPARSNDLTRLRADSTPAPRGPATVRSVCETFLMNHYPSLPGWAILAVCASFAPAALAIPAGTEDPATDPAVETVRVLEPRPPGPAPVELQGSDLTTGEPDLTRALARMPGVEAVDNGPLSGQLQVRGLYGPRIGVRLEGMHVLGGGPNWMDPPLYVAPAGLVESVILDRAPAGRRRRRRPGAQAELRWKQAPFSDDGVRPWLELDASAHSVDRGTALAAVAGLSAPRHRLHVAASREHGEDRDTPMGRIEPSRHDRDAPWPSATAGATRPARSASPGAGSNPTPVARPPCRWTSASSTPRSCSWRRVISWAKSSSD